MIEHYTSETKFVVFTASYVSSTVRLECEGGFSVVLHIFDGTQKLTFRIEMSTLLALSKVIDLWKDKQNPVGEK